MIFPLTQMSVELDVFVGNTTIMDEEVYQLWLDGYTGIRVTVFAETLIIPGKELTIQAFVTCKGT